MTHDGPRWTEMNQDDPKWTAFFLHFFEVFLRSRLVALLVKPRKQFCVQERARIRSPFECGHVCDHDGSGDLRVAGVRKFLLRSGVAAHIGDAVPGSPGDQIAARGPDLPAACIKGLAHREVGIGTRPALDRRRAFAKKLRDGLPGGKHFCHRRTYSSRPSCTARTMEIFRQARR